MNGQTYQSGSGTLVMVFHRAAKYMADCSVSLTACSVFFNLRTTQANSSHKSSSPLPKSTFFENMSDACVERKQSYRHTLKLAKYFLWYNTSPFLRLYVYDQCSWNGVAMVQIMTPVCLSYPAGGWAFIIGVATAQHCEYIELIQVICILKVHI